MAEVKKLGTGIAALVLCALVALTAAAPARGAGPVYFMAVNDQLLELSDATMPAILEGVLYVPYTMLSTNSTGVNLGVYATYSAAAGRVLVFSNRKQLIFDLQSNLTYDMNGRYYSERAILRNSTVYLPIARVCSVFQENIYYSLSRVSYGYLVRVRNGSAVLGDEAFIDAADSNMRSELRRYEASSPDQEPDVSPTPTPPPVSGNQAGVYLAFTLWDGAETQPATVSQLLAGLSSQNGHGLFFLTAEQLAREDDLVRRLLGSGHLVGLRVTSGSAAGALEELEQGAATLAAAAHCRLNLVLAEGLSGGEREELEQAGYVCWTTSVDGRSLTGSGASRAAALIGRMDREEMARNYLLLDNGAGETLTTVLSVLAQRGFQFRTPVASQL